MSSTPVFAYLTGIVMKKEPFHRRVLSGILLSMAGVSAVILFGARAVDFHSSWFGDTLILLSAICWGCYTGTAARLILKYGALRLTFWVMLTGTTAMLPPLLPFLIRQDWHAIPVHGWLGFMYSAILAIVYGYLTWAYALQHLGVARTAIYSNVTPLIALFGGWVLLAEQPTPAQLAGVALILSGVFLVRTQGVTLRLPRSSLRVGAPALPDKGSGR
jgi:drug/metabolite transporter (DMT)-like permease